MFFDIDTRQLARNRPRPPLPETMDEPKRGKNKKKSASFPIYTRVSPNIRDAASCVACQGYAVVDCEGFKSELYAASRSVFHGPSQCKITPGVTFPASLPIEHVFKKKPRKLHKFNDGRCVIMPGFGASGLPCTKYSKEARKLQSRVNMRWAEFINEYRKAPAVIDAMEKTAHEMGGAPRDVFYSVGLDRVCHRLKGKAPGKESPHRDQSYDKKTKKRRYVVFGGFINANETDGQHQFFTCLPSSHNLFDASAGGFKPVREEDVPDGGWIRVVVPPCHMLIFDETILHRVTGKTADYDIYRFFETARVWIGAGPCSEDKCESPCEDKRKCFGCVTVEGFKKGWFGTIKSGQPVPLYPKTYDLNFPGFSNEIKRQLLAAPIYVKGYAVHPGMGEQQYTAEEKQDFLGRRIGEF